MTMQLIQNGDYGKTSSFVFNHLWEISMLVMIRLMLVFAVCVVMNVANAAETKQMQTTGPKTMLEDDKDATDEYAIQLDSSNIDLDEEEEEMNEAAQEYQQKHTAPKANQKQILWRRL